MSMRTIVLVLAAALAAPALAAPTAYEAKRSELLSRFGALQANEAGLTDRERFQALVDLSFEHFLNETPEMATYIGMPVGQDRWSDNSLAAEAKKDADVAMALALLGDIDRGALEAGDRLDYDLLLDSLRSQQEGLAFPEEYLAIDQMDGIHAWVAQVVATMPARNLADYENLVARLEGVPRLVDNTVDKLRKGLELGITPPKVTLRDLPTQVRNLVVDDPMDSPLLAAFGAFPEGLPAAERERLAAAARRAYTEGIAPAFERLADFLEETYVPGAREAIAMGALPGGEAWYAHRVREMTTTDLTPQQIHEIGLAEVARIRREMEAAIAATGFEGSFEEFTELLRTDPRFFFTSGEELLAAYRDIAKRADAELPKLFRTLPRQPYGVIAVPDFKAKSSTTAYYEPGSMEAGRPGYFFANTYALDQRPSWEMEALTLHEAVPGHHLQVALSMEQEDLPWFRRFGFETAFVEGWGLYAESLGTEMGFYRDPYSRFGQLTYEMWRAIRLVLDTGIHRLGWSRQQAIDYFTANSSKAEHDIVVEVDRYIAWPGQALAYKIGELKIKELRAFAERELGDRFDVRAFHDAVLGRGALPLDVLEASIREWVASQKPPAPDSVPVGR